MFSPAVYAMQKHFLTFFPDTCMWSNLGRSDLILLSVTFYNFMPLFLVIACYNHLNYSSTFWNSQLASTWTYIISFFFQAPCYLCCLFFLVIFLTNQPLQSYRTTSQSLPLYPHGFIYIILLWYSPGLKAVYFVWDVIRHWEEPVPPSAVVWCFSIHR